MRILMPFWTIDILGTSFVLPLMKSISERLVSETNFAFHVVHIKGEPKQEWKQYFSFHKMDLPSTFMRSKMAQFFLSRKKLYNQIQGVEADVIFALSEPWTQEFSKYCSKKMGIPYVVRLRGNHKAVRRAMKTNPLKEGVVNYLENRSLKQANLVIPASKDLARRATEWGVSEERITPPVWNGVDTHMFRPMTVERFNEFTIAYAGRISPEKRVQLLLKLAETQSDVQLIIAGKKEMPIAFPSNVKYLGELPFPEMPTFYNKADLVVLPSATEGFPNAVLEAYACGKPVLAAREAFPEELKVFGSVVDIDEFEREVKVLKYSDLKTMGTQARSYVQDNYTWLRFSKSVIHYLKGLTNQP